MNVPALKWERENEDNALECYKSIMSGKQLENFKVHGNISEIHQSIKIHKTGFIIDADEPWLGASPDAEIICECCGEGVVEIKCPSKHKDNSVSLVAKTEEL